MQIHTTYVPGMIGEVAKLHGRYYAEHWRFGAAFEATVAKGVADFFLRLQPDDLVLTAIDDQGVAACIFMDLHDPDTCGRGARLRWFFVTDRMRGTGIGRDLMDRAMRHADTHAGGRAWLTTFAGLDAARHLYERNGFRLVREEEGDTWGVRVAEQEFRRG